MAFVLETGAGLVDSNAFADDVEADAYWADRGGAPATWSSLSTSAKQGYLVLASDWLQRRYSSRWRGQKFSEAQAMDWPRIAAYDDDGYLFDSDEIPVQLKQATILMANEHASGTVDANVTNPGTISSKSVKAGPIERAISYASPAGQLPKYTKVELLVRELTHSDQGVSVW